jgi:hypothetical protein
MTVMHVDDVRSMFAVKGKVCCFVVSQMQLFSAAPDYVAGQ